MKQMDRDELNALRVTAADAANEAEHFMVCPVCRQAFDMRRLGDALYHDEPDHEPLQVN